ncbi:hypothetical protein ScPMuIL_001387, partial [Solemya velum]
MSWLLKRCCLCDVHMVARCDPLLSRVSSASVTKETLQLLGWSSRAVDKEIAPKSEIGDGDVLDQEGDNLYRITKAEFQKLRDQVNDVGHSIKNRFRTSAYQKLYSPTNGENINQIYRTQLAASFKAFKTRDWSPVNLQDEDSSFFRCKPLNVQTNEKQRNHHGPPREKAVSGVRVVAASFRLLLDGFLLAPKGATMVVI